METENVLAVAGLDTPDDGAIALGLLVAAVPSWRAARSTPDRLLREA